MRSHLFRMLAMWLIIASGCSKPYQEESFPTAASGSETPISNETPRDADIERLIGDLCSLDTIAVGLHPTASVTAFLATNDDAQFTGGVIGSQAPMANPTMRRLVQLGVNALPSLIAHLGDKRPTKLTVGNQFPIEWCRFDQEYDRRGRSEHEEAESSFERMFTGGYVVKIGDVCFVLIGQIVNRSLLAVRYQPSGGMVVNSPIESPDLVVEVRRDWCALTQQQHLESLMTDLENADGAWDGTPALVRIRYYYPDAIPAIKSKLLKKKVADIDAAVGK